MSFDIHKNVSGFFTSDNRRQEIEIFSVAARGTVYNYTGCAFSSSDPDNVRFIFDGEENQQSIDELDAFLIGYTDVSLVTKRVEVMNKINALRDTIQYDHFIFNGARWDSRAESRAMITGAVALALANGGVLPPDFIFRDYDNINRPMTGAQMAGLGAALFAFTGQCYQASWIHKYWIGIQTTEADIDNYDYTVGWPVVEL